MADVVIIGGGLAGSEAAWQAAGQGMRVRLFEMRPLAKTGAHTGGALAELVCSNSLGSNLIDRASGLLKEEARRLGSLLLDCAEKTSLPAGGALAVDREAFAQLVTEKITSHPSIEVVRETMDEIPTSPAIIASGPLTSPGLSAALQRLTSEENLFFYDAIAPIVARETVNMEVAFIASRYDRGGSPVGGAEGGPEGGPDGDYINCPLNQEEYDRFVDALCQAERIAIRSFEQDLETGVRAGITGYFEGCLPVEILAGRGRLSLAFGPMRPVGLYNPHTGRRPFAVVQLRQDNLAGSLYNLVGFQTNLAYGEQKRVLRMIPGLEQAEFVRYGQMHRNTFIASPRLLLPTLQYRSRNDLLFAGQITGVEGYMGNIATGLLAGQNLARIVKGMPPLELPRTTMLGALCHYVTNARMDDFQPMKANFGILPLLDEAGKTNKRQRAAMYADRSLRDLTEYLHKINGTTGHVQLFAASSSS
jgi:methylenetetrahydrofolate--tRNA-(uracil-5-)-methyltransferase